MMGDFEIYSGSYYSGNFIIELQTKYFANDAMLVQKLDNISSGKSNSVPGQTRWEIVDLKLALDIVILLQDKRCAFKLLGEGNIVFIEMLEDLTYSYFKIDLPMN